MGTFQSLLFVLFVLVVVKSEEVDLALNKKAFQSTMREAFKAELAVDGDADTCSETNNTFHASWLVVDLGKQQQIGEVHFKSLALISTENMKGRAHVLRMNDFDASSNPPNPSVHNVCWRSEKFCCYEKVFSENVTCSKNTSSYRYVAIWFPVRYKLKVCDLQVFRRAEEVNVALHKKAFLSSTYGHFKTEWPVDGNVSTCSVTDATSVPSWLVVDLDKQYHIGRIQLEGFADGRSGNMKGRVHVLRMNEFDASSNPPNPSVHNVCWRSDEFSGRIDLPNENVTCSETNIPYQYVALWVSAGYYMNVCDLQVFEAPPENSAATKA